MREKMSSYSGLIYDLDINEYHKQLSLEEHNFSSSQLKDVLIDPELFYKKYIKKEIPRETTSAFDIGHYFHSAILEPHTLDADFAVYTGSVRRGSKWEKFKANNPDKIYLTQSDLDRANILIAAVEESPIAMDLLKGGQAEVSLFVEVYVYEGTIYYINTERDSLYSLSLELGFIRYIGKDFKAIKSKGIKVRLKVRSDYMTDKYILDLKSTSSNSKSEYEIHKAVEKYSYDMSAALYLDLFNLFSKKYNMQHFYWTFASKTFQNSRTYVASQNMIRVGRAKWSKAVKVIANLIETDFTFHDELVTLEPFSYEKDMYLKDIDQELISTLEAI